MMLIITFLNDQTGDDFAANYDVLVRVNKGIVYRGRIEAHNRTKGWRELVRQLSDAPTLTTTVEAAPPRAGRGGRT